MSDEADINDYAERHIEASVAAARGVIKPGQPGECELCGEWSGRLIGGACAPCRDKYGLE